jgi:hypothetical protein
MYYGNYPYRGWPSPWESPRGMGYPGMGGWGYPYAGMGQMPYSPPWGGFGFPDAQPYGPPMQGGYGAPGMQPYGPPMQGGYGAPGMQPYGPPMQGGYGAPGMQPYGPPVPPEQEIEFLSDQAHMLKDQLDQIDARIKELEKKGK